MFSIFPIMMNSVLRTVIFFMVSTTIFANSNNEEPFGSKTQLFASVIPQQYIIDRIGGEKVSTNVLVGPGKSPATYQPTPKQMIKLSNSKILFTIGVSFEKAYLNKAISTLDSLMVVDSSKGIIKKGIDSHLDGEFSEEEGHSESENLDPHVWLSPKLAKVIAKNILDALILTDPNGKEYYILQFNTLISELTDLENELHAILDPLKGKTIFVYHPSFGYFLDEYGIKQKAVETGGKQPTPKQLENIIREAKSDGVKIIVVQPEFSRKSANVIAEAIGGKVTTLNPLEYNYISNLRYIANKLKSAY